LGKRGEWNNFKNVAKPFGHPETQSFSVPPQEGFAKDLKGRVTGKNKNNNKTKERKNPSSSLTATPPKTPEKR